MCAGAVVAARMARVVWGAPDEQAGCAGSVYRLTEDPAFSHYAPSDGYVLEAESRALLDAFFKAARARRASKAAHAGEMSGAHTPVATPDAQ